MMQMSEPRSRFRDSLEMVLKARFPVLYVESFEEDRVLAEIHAVASDAGRIRTPRPVWTWSTTQGLVDMQGKVQAKTTEPAAALEQVLNHAEPAVFVFRDLHAFLGDTQRPADLTVVRRIRDIAAAFQNGPAARTLLLVSPLLRIPPELEKEVSLLDFPLPGDAEIRRLLEGMIATNGAGVSVHIDEAGKERFAKAALGLTLHEAENAFARAMVNDSSLREEDLEVIIEEKRQTIRKSGLLEFVPADLDLDDVGGLQNLKEWLGKRDNSWLDEAVEYGLPAPRGMLMTGVPGCGKSLTAKAIASAWGLPLLRLDIGKIFAGLVGSSEQNMRNAIRAAEATAPCVLWIDEIEKGFGGVSGSGGDSGTSSRVFGSFLTWLQEKSSNVFVIATANRVEALPPEFLRKGRFDEIFFVDLPTRTERLAVWQVHLQRRLAAAPKAAGMALTPDLVGRLADASEGYSGAEIEQAVIGGLFDAYAERRPLTEDDLTTALSNMVPLSVTQSEQIQTIRHWAATRAVAATATEDRTGYSTSEAGAAEMNSPSLHNATTRHRGGRVVDFRPRKVDS